MAKHYDVVILGAGTGALVAAALLARRSWRVMVLGQGYRPAHYLFEGLPLARRPFTFLVGASPAWARVLHELAQSQSFRRSMTRVDPLFQVLGPGLRLSVSAEPERLGAEVQREFPEVHRVVEELCAELGRANDSIDGVFSRDVVWPDGTFWDRREASRAAAALPYRGPGAREVLTHLPADHGFRSVVETPAHFASHLAAPLSSLEIARLWGGWTRGLSEVVGGEAGLVDFLLDRVRAHGGDVRLGARATQLEAAKGRVTAVHVDGDDEPTGVQFLVSEGTSGSTLDLTSEFRLSRRILDSRPQPEVEAHRFVVSLLVRTAGLPVPLAQEAFVVGERSWGGKSAVHVQRSVVPSPVPGTTLLVAETFLGATSPLDRERLRRARASVVATLEGVFPFVERHYLLIDSPHDGLPLWDYRSGSRVLVDRAQLRVGGGPVEPEPMVPKLRFEAGARGGAVRPVGEPLRAAVGGTLSVGPSVLPGLGQEGELLAAWAVARVITRTDRRRARMTREMWSKVELRG